MKCDFYISKDDRELIDNMLDELREYSSSNLTKITLIQEPWIRSYVPQFNRVISRKLIRKYFMED